MRHQHLGIARSWVTHPKCLGELVWVKNLNQTQKKRESVLVKIAPIKARITQNYFGERKQEIKKNR